MNASTDTRLRVPTAGSHADLTLQAGAALVGIMRLAPAGLALDDVTIRPTDGKVTLLISDLWAAVALAEYLHLPKALYPTELDHRVVVQRWSGTWAGHPVTLLCHLPAIERTQVAR